MWVIISCGLQATELVQAQSTILVEDYEYASSDPAAQAGSIDLSDSCNQPTFFISGSAENASPNEVGGFFSIGTDAVYCINPSCQQCLAGTFIGLRRFVDPARWPLTCPQGDNFVPLQFSYGDPANPGPIPPDAPLSDLGTVWDVYGDGAFADGLTGTHLWLRLVDCEGEIYEFVNFSETSLYSQIWTFDVQMGTGFVRLAPESLVDVPNGDRLLTEIVASEVLIQDVDDPPTTFGKWYVDYLRVVESVFIFGDFNGDGYFDMVDFAAFPGCLTGPLATLVSGCEAFDAGQDGHVDLRDWGAVQTALVP